LHLARKEINITNNIMLLIGEDFFGENFIGAFMNLDMLIKLFNEKYGS
jgi:hypothetical protein